MTIKLVRVSNHATITLRQVFEVGSSGDSQHGCWVMLGTGWVSVCVDWLATGDLGLALLLLLSLLLLVALPLVRGQEVLVVGRLDVVEHFLAVQLCN